MKTVIVSGASGNLGKAICAKFLQHEYHVIGTATGKNKPAFAESNFESKVLDLADASAEEQMVEEVVAKYQAIDAAILTVGGFAMGKIADTSIHELQQQFQLNFATTYNLARPIFLQMMKQGRGHIFLTGARTGSDMRLSRGTVAYGLSKSLVFRLAELMNEEAKGTDVVTGVISPSIIDTPQNRAAIPNADFDKWVKAEAIANIVYEACQPEAGILREPILKVYHHS